MLTTQELCALWSETCGKMRLLSIQDTAAMQGARFELEVDARLEAFSVVMMTYLLSILLPTLFKCWSKHPYAAEISIAQFQNKDHRIETNNNPR